MARRTKSSRSRDAVRRTAAKAGAARARKAMKAVGRRPRRAKGGAGILIAEGDSWFDYPLFDLLEELEDQHGYDVVESVAHKGDTVEEMAYDDGQLRKLAKMFQKVGSRLRDDQGNQGAPKAILLSGGGNDIAGDEFAMFLNHRASGLPTIHDGIVDGIIDERLYAAITSLVRAVTVLSEGYFGKKVPIVLHGYAYPVPDGRGYLGGAWVLPGPWLEPGFRQKGYEDLEQNTKVMKKLIDRFNAVVKRVAADPGHAHVGFVDLRKTLSNAIPRRAYRKSWGDELHPTRSGFRKVAAEFDKHIGRL